MAVARILGDGNRRRAKVFSELQSHYLFADRFGRPGNGNDKGKVEGLFGNALLNFMMPIPLDSGDRHSAFHQARPDGGICRGIERGPGQRDGAVNHRAIGLLRNTMRSEFRLMIHRRQRVDTD
jgi:transposase